MRKLHQNVILVLTLILASAWVGGCRTAQPTQQPTALPATQPAATEPAATIPPAAEATATEAPASTATAADEPTPAPTRPPQSDTDWDDRAIFRQGLIGAEQEALDRLPGASVYHIDLQIPADFALLRGREEVRYTNQEHEPLNEVYLRLFPNLAGGVATVSALQVDGQAVEPSYEYENSAVRVPLPAALPPGAQTVIQMEFEVQVAREMAGNYGLFGYFDGVLVLDEFYPVIPVYDDEGWNVEVTPPNGDATYFDASFYLVRVTAPSDLTVVTSGVQVVHEDQGDEQLLTFAAGPTRDFYLAASDNYIVVSKTVGETTVNSYAFPEWTEGAELALKYTVQALKSFNERFGVYPYTEFDVASTPMRALGIEYPGMTGITLSAYDPRAEIAGLPSQIILESTVAHEVAHQWFYNAVGSDQVDEPWLDEAVVQYATGLYYVDVYGEAAAQGYRASWYGRWDRVDRAEIPIGLSCHAYAENEYSPIVYGRGPLFIQALANEMGQEVFDGFLRDYYQSHKWDIATGETFRRLAEQHCQCDLGALFEEWVYESPAAAQPDEAAPPTSELPAVDDLVAKLAGLDLDDFFEVSWRELMLRDPEGVLAEGLAEVYGLEGAELTDISDAYIRETQQMQATVLERLRTYDRDALSPEQQISYDVYEWYLEDQVRQQEFMYYDYPATFFPITAVHQQVIYFFTDLHPIASKQDAADYVTRLGQVDTKFEQLLEGLRLRTEAGIVPPRFATQWALYGVRNLAQSDAVHTPFYEAFEAKVNALPDVSAAEKRALLEAAQEAINTAVLPAFQALADYLGHLESIASTDDGLWQFTAGDAYYDYLLRHHTTTDMTADEIYELGLRELERIHAEMRVIFDELGYPEDESLAELFDRVAEDGGHVAANQVFETYEQLIEQADQNLDAAFDIRPQAELIVVASPIKGMYVSASLDGSRPGAFHAGPGNAREEWYAMPTLAYHEAVPGHHFQISLAQESDLPSFRNSVSFVGYAEGWALYAEQLAWELGWYEDDPYGNLGRLQAEAFRAARLVIDTGIHTKGWTFDQASAYLIENVGFESGDSVDPDIQIARYIVWPGQATAYKIGMLKMLELRQRAMEQLGDQFDLQEFHNVVLSNGSMPLEVLERVVDDYIEARLALAPDDDVITVGLYADDGAEEACATAAEKMFEWMGYTVERVYADTINNQDVGHLDLLYFPGGSAHPYQQDITPEGMEKIRQRVQAGGCFIGTCAGALFAAERVVWEEHVDPHDTLALFPGTVEGPIADIYADPQHGMCQVNLEPHPITDTEPDPAWILYYNGPFFKPNPGAEVDIVGRYQITNEPALVAFEYGQGRVFLTGPHPEWDEDSDRDDVSYFDRFDDQGSDWPLMLNAARWCLRQDG